MNLDVTQTISQNDLIMDPCPYFHIKNALPDEIYNELVNTYPEAYMNPPDSKLFFQARRYRQHEHMEHTISPLWREFIDYHNSVEFKNRILDLFAPAIEKYYPDFQSEWQAAPVIERHKSKPGSIQMEMQFVLNGQQDTTVRTVHLDNSRELFAGLLYMRKPEDNSIGGDIQVYRKINSNPDFKGIREIADLEQVEVAGTVPYQPNTMILFLNTVDTLHGVTPRHGANVVRRYINIDGHQDRKLFKI